MFAVRRECHRSRQLCHRYHVRDVYVPLTPGDMYLNQFGPLADHMHSVVLVLTMIKGIEHCMLEFGSRRLLRLTAF